jgi:hypothetical protein
MNDLIIEEKKDNLGIKCSKGKISMTGNSLLPNAQKFFQPVEEWVDAYVKSPAPKTTITLKFNYVDTASVQAIFNVLKKFREIPDYEENVVVNWHFEFDDPELLEVGEIMEGRLKLKFNYIEFSED